MKTQSPFSKIFYLKSNVMSIISLLKTTRAASGQVRALGNAQKTQLLHDIAEAISQNKQHIIAENEKDLVRMADDNPKKDRLALNNDRIGGLVSSLHEVAKLSDPAGQILSEKTLENGLKVQKMSVPLGVVGVIYESRPNVTVDVAALCLRSGNACVLRGGSDAIFSNTCLVDLIHGALQKNGVDKSVVQLLPTNRELVNELLQADRFVDIIIPRGSQQLIDFVRQNASVPVIETGAGVCHTYVAQSADLRKAAQIVINAKVSRPSVCNALDTILVDATLADDFLPLLCSEFEKYEVDVFADGLAYEIFEKAAYLRLKRAEADDFGREFLGYACSAKVVHSPEAALQHIAQYSSRHSEAIVSDDVQLCERFLNEVDAAAVYANASTRFTDGGVFGLGAEIGISTQKLHARGPFALEKLVTEKWVVRGTGQVRW